MCQWAGQCGQTQSDRPWVCQFYFGTVLPLILIFNENEVSLSIFIKSHNPGVLCNKGHPSETHLKLKSHVILFFHNICHGCEIVWKFCTEHGSNTAVLCAKIEDDWIIDTYAAGERDFADFECPTA